MNLCMYIRVIRVGNDFWGKTMFQPGALVVELGYVTIGGARLDTPHRVATLVALDARCLIRVVIADEPAAAHRQTIFAFVALCVWGTVPFLNITQRT